VSGVACGSTHCLCLVTGLTSATTMARSCVVALAVGSVMAVATPGALGLDNGMGLLPIRGVSSWCVQGQVSNTLH
jgi:hypothetical protein